MAAEGADDAPASIVSRGLGWAVAFFVLALALAGLVTGLGGKGAEVRALLVAADPVALVAGWACMTTGMVALAARWRAFFPPDSGARLGPLTAILFVGMLLNYSLPGPVGEFVGAAMAARRFKLPTEVALAAGVAARLVGLALAGIGALVAVESGAVTLPEAARPWLRTAAMVLALGACGLAALGAFPHRLRQVGDLTVGRVPGLRTLHAAVVRFAEALGALGRVGPGPYLRAAGWALVGHGLVMGGIAVLAYGLGAPVQLGGLGFTYAASTAGAVALFAFPGGQVGWDAMFVSLLTTTAGIDLAPALAVTLGVRLQQLTLVAGGALVLVGWMRDGTAGLRG